LYTVLYIINNFQPGQNERELNPHWKDGGKGLPEEEKSSDLQLPSKSVGDQGSGWLRKALQRIYEQSDETGEDPEDIAAERWGVQYFSKA
jgi:hypothetical protein